MEKESQKKSFLSYIPGFRHNKLSHKIIATFYYFSILLESFSGNIPTVFFALSIPFLFFYGIDFFKTKNKQSLTIAIAALLVFLIASFFNESNLLVNSTVSTNELNGKNYATISVDKNSLESITIDDYQEFLQKRVSEQTYDWITIDFNDGSGIVFPSSEPNEAIYGKIDDYGQIITGDRNIIVKSNLDATPLEIELTSIIPNYETSIDTLEKPSQEVDTDSYIKQLSTFSDEYEVWAQEFTNYAPTLLAVEEPSEERDQKLTEFKNKLQEISTEILNNYPDERIAQEILQPIVHDEIYKDTKLVCDHIDYFLSNPEINGKEYASEACALLVNEKIPIAIKSAQNEATVTTEKIQAVKIQEEKALEEKAQTKETQNTNFQSYNNDTSGSTCIGNSNTLKFHNPTCSSVKKIKPEHVQKLDSREQAINNGYIPCKRCHP